MRPIACCLTALTLALGLGSALAEEQPLRLKDLQRCGDLFSTEHLTFCLSSEGAANANLEVMLRGKPIETARGKNGRLRLTLNRKEHQSGPLWLEQGDRRSNPVWLTLNGSHVIPASPDEVAKNMDGLTTYVDLVSVIIEEDHDGLEASRRLAEKYGAEVVGVIAPLNTYQLRLPVNNLTERDAMVLRLGSETNVDAVVIEESGAEEPLEEDKQSRPRNSEWVANRFLDAVDFYRRRLPARKAPIDTHPVRIGIIERDVDFDSPEFAAYLNRCDPAKPKTCVYARDAASPADHGTSVTGILAARSAEPGDSGFLSALEASSSGFEVIVERNSDAGITANVAASVNLVEDGVRVLNWSWGIHRVGTLDVDGEEIDSLVRSGVAMSGYEELLEEFFLWLRREHPDVVVVNSAGNGSAHSGQDDYRLPSSFITEQLLVVGAHQRDFSRDVPVEHPDYVTKRPSSNIDMRVDITASACTRAATLETGKRGEVHCGTSYATPMVTGIVGAMLSINPALAPEQLRELLRRSALTIGRDSDFEPAEADDLTAPILPSERSYQLDNQDIGRSARLDMRKALELTVDSLQHVR
ncbi:S8/S53 family peptidase [Stutzerimonas xanthomarina]|uniref:Subtilase family protein n=2 Tax=Stutzerimonas xanthomarina TaxID=271420 RepID=A0A1M5SLJ5_9GAMM|nr:S8/S53 family peptidase [Stutzerimonas xanthomarina]MCP9339061.1 S8/S53 family peptidase [Stutzerimonas xanthomarina]SEI01510.1 Subtilase family protein [Stutzerimonas xanthomarina]SHH39270.1 Subtilase family protein [Stutzerimonas xanthomarina DSM 18231]